MLNWVLVLPSDAVCELLCNGVRGKGRICHFAPIVVIVYRHSYCCSRHFFLLLLLSLIPALNHSIVAHIAAATAPAPWFSVKISLSPGRLLLLVLLVLLVLVTHSSVANAKPIIGASYSSYRS